MTEKPYIEETITTVVRKYNPNYGDDRICQCGHSYYRHFDSWEEMANIGCKYCFCFDFQEADVSEENIAKMREFVITKLVNYKDAPVTEFIDSDTKEDIEQLLEWHYRLQQGDL